MKNSITLNGIKIINLATHSVKINGEDGLLELGANMGLKPILVSEYEEIKGAPIKTYKQIIMSIDNMPEPQKDTIYIVPLFVVNGLSELEKRGEIQKREDVFSPGKKVHGRKGILYADGLRAK